MTSICYNDEHISEVKITEFELKDIVFGKEEDEYRYKL